MRAVPLLALTLTAFSLSVSEASVIYTYKETQPQHMPTPSFLDPLVPTTIGFSLTVPDYLPAGTENSFLGDQFTSCWSIYGLPCTLALLDQTADGVSVNLWLSDDGIYDIAGFPGASLGHDGTYGDPSGDFFSVVDPVSAPEPMPGALLVMGGLGLLLWRSAPALYRALLP